MQALINEYFLVDGQEQEKVIDSVAQQVQQQGVLSLVESLQLQLTGDNGEARSTATRLLARVIDKIRLPSGQFGVLWGFFADRLEDDASFRAAVDGLAALSAKPDANNLSVAVLSGKLKETNFRAKSQVSRHAVFKLLQTFKPSPELLDLFVELATGEKDPQNLMLTLGIADSLAKLSNLEPSQKEDLFDLTFCYFPVTFKAPSNMPYKITADDIRKVLRHTLKNVSLAQYAVPAVISKMGAVNPEVKLDVLTTLLEMVKSYPPEVLHAYWSPVWDGLKYEILHGSAENTEVNELVFDILHQLTDIEDFKLALISQVQQMDPKRKGLATQTCHLIVGVSNSQELADILNKRALEILLQEPLKLGNIEFVNILLSGRYPLTALQDATLSILMTGLSSEDYQVLAIEGLSKLAMQSGEYAPIIVESLVPCLDIHRAKTIECLASIAKVDSEPIADRCLSSLLARLQDKWCTQNKEILLAMAQIAVTKDLVNTVTIRLVSRVGVVATGQSSPNDILQYVFFILSTLITSVGNVTQQDLVGYHRYVLPLLKYFFTPDNSSVFQTEVLVDRMSLLMELTVRAIPDNMQVDYAENVCSLIWPENKNIFGNSPSNLSFLLTGCLAGISERNLPSRFQVSFVKYSDILKRSNLIFQRTGYLRYLAIAVNKWPARFGDAGLAIKWLKTSIETEQDVLSNLEILAWITKGLLLKADPLGFETAQYIASLLGNHKLGPFVAKVFGVLVMNDRVLVKENGVTVRSLYKQRLFVERLPGLLNGFNSKDQQLRLVSLTALSSLIRYTPIKVLSEHLNSVIPVMIDCLNTSLAPMIRSAALATILATVPQKNSLSLYEAYLPELISRLLTLSLESTEPQVRAQSVEALLSIAQNFPRNVAMGYANQVLTKLPDILSDSRRDVRKVTAKCIQQYHQLQVI